MSFRCVLVGSLLPLWFMVQSPWLERLHVLTVLNVILSLAMLKHKVQWYKNGGYVQRNWYNQMQQPDSVLETARFPVSAVSTNWRETSRHKYAHRVEYICSNTCTKLCTQHQKPASKFWCEFLHIFQDNSRRGNVGGCKIMWSINWEISL